MSPIKAWTVQVIASALAAAGILTCLQWPHSGVASGIMPGLLGIDALLVVGTVIWLFRQYNDRNAILYGVAIVFLVIAATILLAGIETAITLYGALTPRSVEGFQAATYIGWGFQVAALLIWFLGILRPSRRRRTMR